MKSIILVLFIFSTNIFASDLFLVTSHEPHLLKVLIPQVKVIKYKGRTLLVKLKKNSELTKEMKASLRPVQESDVLNYMPTISNSLKKNPIIEALISDVTANEMERITTKIASFGKRKAGSDDNVAAANYIESEMKKLGLETSQSCFRRKTCNVYGKVLGTRFPDELIIVEAHLDSVGREFAGADDNASGIAGLLMIAKRITSINPKRSFLFFATNGEEKGLLGAKHYVKQASNNGALAKIKFVINMDMIGYNKTNDLVDLETNKEFVKHAEWMAGVVNTYTKLTPNVVTPAWGSDHVPFLKKGIPSVLTIEHWPTKTPCYHSSCDTADHLTYDYGAEIIKLNIASSYLLSEE